MGIILIIFKCIIKYWFNILNLVENKWTYDNIVQMFILDQK